MKHSDGTWIRFERDRTTLTASTGAEVVVPIGAGAIAKRVFRHDPPTPGEVEQAIDLVEDALASTGLGHTERGDLQTAQPQVLGLLGLQVSSARVTRDQVEMDFERLAAVALGQPAGLVPSGARAATLLILRECMHHLGYAGVRRGKAST